MLCDQQLHEVLDAYAQANGNKAQAANLLGLSPSTFKDRFDVAVRKNMRGDFMGGPMPPGYSLGKVTTLVSQDGTQLQWQHANPDGKSPEEIAEIIEQALSNVQPIPLIPAPAFVLADLATIYPIADLHLMMLSWGKETGDKYDLTIAEDLLKTTAMRLVQAAPFSQTAVILNLGDFFHADNNNATTEKSGNHLDVDSRMDKAIFVGAELMCWFVELALQKHEQVIVRCQRGNHDPNVYRALTVGLWLRYKDNPRVTISRDPAEVWFWQWGRTMIAAHHGDMIKPEQMPGVMASFAPQMWGNTDYRYAYLGHIHHHKKGPVLDEHAGAEYEVFGTLAAKDAWNKAMGHASKRSMCAITHHKESGEYQRSTINVKGA